MRTDAKGSRAGNVDQDIAFAKPSGKRRRRHQVGINVEPYQVALNTVGIESQPATVANGIGKQFRVSMILDQAIEMVIERVNCRRRENSHLPHVSAIQLAHATSASNEVLRSRDCRANRRSETLAETDRHAVERLAPFGQRDAGRSVSIPASSAVE